MVATMIAVVTDLRSRKIYNALTLPLWLLGPVYWLSIATLTDSGALWYTGLLGVVIMLPIHFLMFAVGLDRGGDAKLIIGIGGMLGWVYGLELTIWSILIMGPVGLLILIARGDGAKVVSTLKRAINPIFKAIGRPLAVREDELTYVPKAPAIFAGVLFSSFTPWIDQLIQQAVGL